MESESAGNPTLPRRIEEASLNAWPALQQVLFDGWILRFSRGYTKRANSVNPLFASNMDADAKVDACEELYAERGLPTVFRLTPFSCPSELERILEARGYGLVDPTSVQYLDLRDWDSPSPLTEPAGERLEDWMEVFCRLKGSPIGESQTHKEMLAAIPGNRFLASLADAGQVVACGLGVLENDCFGLFDLITDPHHRNRGHGTELVSGLLRWARDHGGRHAYLQVMHTNKPARHLYGKLGFRELYAYWYRTLGTQRGSDETRIRRASAK